jgi:hypothetical protein
MKRTGAFRSTRPAMSARFARRDAACRDDALANAAHSAVNALPLMAGVNPPLTMIGKDRVVGLNTDAVSVC